MAKKIDHDHPLFLGSSDVPTAVQIGIQLTGMENYILWSRAMQLNLLMKNKLGFIDGSIKRDGFTTEIKKKQWDRFNAMVLSWIMSNVSKDLVSGILFRSNAAQFWLDLQERFDKLKDLWDEFDSIVPPPSCECVRSKDYSYNMGRQKLLQFLMGLNESYAQARSQILMLNPQPSVNQCYAMIVHDESQRALSGEYSGGGITDPTVLLTNKLGGYKFGGSGSRGKGGRGYGSSRQQRGGKKRVNIVQASSGTQAEGFLQMQGQQRSGVELYNHQQPQFGPSTSTSLCNIAVNNPGRDLFTGKVKEIGEEEDGLYMLNNQDQFHIDQGHLLQQEDMRMKYCGIRD
nr:uncharacterized protein LOC112942267 [Solanum lycopersicum]